MTTDLALIDQNLDSGLYIPSMDNSGSFNRLIVNHKKVHFEYDESKYDTPNKSLKVVITGVMMDRVLWAYRDQDRKYVQGDVERACWSSDSVKPHPSAKYYGVHDTCKACPFSQWDNSKKDPADRRPKCELQFNFIGLFADESKEVEDLLGLPFLFSVKGSSFKAAQKYVEAFVRDVKGRKIYQYVTTIQLTDKNTYAAIDFSRSQDPISEELATLIKLEEFRGLTGQTLKRIIETSGSVSDSKVTDQEEVSLLKDVEVKTVEVVNSENVEI